MLVLGNKLTLNAQKPIYHFVNKYSIVFDGVDDCIITDGADTVAQPTTYSFWSKSSEGGANFGVFGHGASPRCSFNFNYLSSKPLLELGPSYYIIWSDNPAQDDGEWHHWVVYSDTNDITNSKLYCDGVLQTVDPLSTYTGSSNPYTESLTIGGDKAVGGNYFKGNIDEFAVFDRELTQEEITRMYNTYYSPNRVANGNFSQIGNEEVENGDFSEVGAEEITNYNLNGNFSDTSALHTWIGWLGGSFAPSAGVNDGSIRITSSGGIRLNGLYMGVVVDKLYKVSVLASTDTGTALLNCSGDLTNYTLQQTVTTTPTTFDFYVTYSSYITFVGDLTTSNILTLDDISVKEVGQDWTVSGSDSTHYVEFLNTGARFVSDTTSPVLELKQDAITSGNQYVLTCNVAYTGAGQLRVNVGDNLTPFTEGANTRYFSATSNTISFLRQNANVDALITNVSVKEVGQGWSANQGWEIGDGVVNRTATSADFLFSETGTPTIGATYKVSFKMTSYTTGTNYLSFAGSYLAFSQSAVGDYSYNIVATSTQKIGFYGTTDSVYSLDNVVVQELKHDATNLMLNAGAYQSANPLITSTNSMEFDGLDEYLTVADNSSLDFVAGFSVSYWVYPQAADSNDRMVCKGTTGSGNWMISFAGGQAIRVYAQDDNGQTADFSSSNTLTLNEWAMVTVVINRTTNYVQVYKNGGNLTEGAATWTGGFNTSIPLTMGVNSSLAGDFDGRMTEVGVWDREITALEVASLYNQGMPTNLLVNRNDYQSGNPTVFNTKQVDFDGVDDRLVANSTLGSITGTLSFWFKRDIGGTSQFLADARGVSATGTGYVLFLNSNLSATVSSGTIYVNGVAGNVAMALNEWHYLVVTGITLDITEDISIASKNSSQNFFNGQLSQVGLWNSTLTADEVSSLYNHGLPVDLTIDQAAYESSSNLVGYWRMGSGTLDSYPLIADQTNATLGSELVTNGNFTGVTNGTDVITLSGWGAYGSPTSRNVVDNKLVIVATGGNQGAIYAVGSLSGTYKLSVDVTGDVGAGAIYIESPASNNITTSVGTVDYYFVASGTTSIYFRAASNSAGTTSYTNISVKQVNGNPAIMTNMTASDIMNGSPYAQLVQNSDFDSSTNWDLTGTNIPLIEDGLLKFSFSTGTYSRAKQTPLGAGTFNVTYVVKTSSNASLTLREYSGTSSQTIPSTVGTHTVQKTFTGNGFALQSGGNDTGVLELESITISEVNTGLQGYWKMGSGINDEYPVIYDQTNPTLSAELVTNGDFSNGTTDWTVSSGTISVDNGRLKIDSVNGTTAEQTVTAIVGKTYKVTYDLTLGTAISGATIITGGNYPTLDAPEGTNIFYSLATSTSFRVRPRLGSDGTMFVDNVSVKEVQGNPATMTNMVEGNITNQYPLTKIRNYYRMGDGILDKFPCIQDQTSPNLAHIPTTNLINYSEDFSNAVWTKNNTITSNLAISPSGLLDADKMVCNANSTNYLYFSDTYPLTATGNYTNSIYLKKDTSSGWMVLRIWSGSGTIGVNVWFDLDNGILGTSSSSGGFTLINAASETLTNDWYRLTISAITNGTSYFRLDFVDGDGLNAYTNVSGKSCFIWGAQAEQQSQATAYLPSYGIASVRKATTTNLLLYSEDFSQSYWTKTGASVTSGFTSPNGTTNAFKLVEDTSTGRHETQAPSSSSGDLSISFFAKKGENSFIQITNSQDPVAYANFDLNFGVLGSSNIFTPTIIDYGNGWYRCIATINAPLAINFARIGLITSSTSARVESYTGDGTSGVYIYGAQLEEQTQAETYAPTFGLPVTIDLFTENNYGTMINMTAGDIVPDTPNN